MLIVVLDLFELQLDDVWCVACEAPDLRSDAAECEADRVADTVARGGTPGPILQAPSARIHRGPDDQTCEEPNTGSFVLDPAIADVATPARMSTHVRLAPVKTA